MKSPFFVDRVEMSSGNQKVRSVVFSTLLVLNSAIHILQACTQNRVPPW